MVTDETNLITLVPSPLNAARRLMMGVAVWAVLWELIAPVAWFLAR